MRFRKFLNRFKKGNSKQKMSQLILQAKNEYKIKNRYKRRAKECFVGIFCDPFRLFRSVQGDHILGGRDILGMLVSIVVIVVFILGLYALGGLFLALFSEDAYWMISINGNSFFKIVFSFAKGVKNLASGGDVLGGFVTIWIGILIYMADSKGQEKTFKSRVLFDNTSVWALSVSTIFLFISQNWGSIVGINKDYGYLPISILGLAYIYVTGVIIKISTYSSALDRGIMKYLNEEIRKDVEGGINNILGQEIFAQKMDNNPHLSYNPFWGKEDGITILSGKEGVVTDIFFGSNINGVPINDPNKPDVYLKARFGDRIEKGSALGIINKSLSPDEIRRITEEVQNMYQIEDDRNVGSELDERIEILLNQISTSISNRDPLELRRGLKLFRVIIENTIQIFQEMNIKIGCFELSKVSKDIFGNGITIFNLIRDTAWEIYRLAPREMDNARLNLELKEVMSFIESMIYISLNKDDRPFSVIFMGFIPSLISDGVINNVNGDSEVHQLRLSNLFQYHLYPHLKAIEEEDASLDFARYILVLGRDILTTFLRNGNYQACFDMLDLLYEFDKYANNADKQYTKIFSQERSKMLFGFGAYLAKTIGTKENPDHTFTKEHELLTKILRHICKNFTDWTKLYAYSFQRDDEDLWSCRFLDRPPADGRLYSVDSSGPGRLYIIGAFYLNNIEYSFSEDVPDLFYHENFGELISSTRMPGIDISELKRNNLTAKIRELAIRVRKQRLTDRKRQDLSQKILNDFKKETQEGFEKILIGIKEMVGPISSERIDSDIVYGTGGQLLEKECFLEDGNISISGFGDNVGEHLGKNLQGLIISSIVQNCTLRGKVNNTNLLGEIDELLKGMMDPIIILTGGYNYALIEKLTTRSLIGKPKLGICGFYVKNHSIPIFDPYYRDMVGNILVVDRAKFGNLKIPSQKAPKENKDIEEIEYVSVDIKDINSNQDLLDKLLLNPPLGIEDKLKVYDDILEEYLRDMVYYRVSYQYEFMPENNCGFVLNHEDDDEI